jgi:hypothetical protein
MEMNLDFDEVMGIEEIGDLEVYDFVIPESHCYFANGVLIHNSGDLEQDADIVVGIYRDDRESEVMELGGLKGRDVGTWVTQVNFDRYTQRVS